MTGGYDVDDRFRGTGEREHNIVHTHGSRGPRFCAYMLIYEAP
jgi:hypothetical protein